MKNFQHGDKPTAAQWNNIFSMIEEIAYNDYYNIGQLTQFSTDEVVTNAKLQQVFKLLVPQIPQTKFGSWMQNFIDGAKPDEQDFNNMFQFAYNQDNVFVDNPGYIVTPFQSQSNENMQLKAIQFKNNIATYANILNAWPTLPIHNLTNVSCIIAGMCNDSSDAIYYPIASYMASNENIIAFNLYANNQLNIDYVVINDLLVNNVVKAFDVGSGGGSMTKEGAFILIDTTGTNSSNYSVYNWLITSHGALYQQQLLVATLPLSGAIDYTTTKYSMFS